MTNAEIAEKIFEDGKNVAIELLAKAHELVKQSPGQIDGTVIAIGLSMALGKVISDTPEGIRPLFRQRAIEEVDRTIAGLGKLQQAEIDSGYKH